MKLLFKNFIELHRGYDLPKNKRERGQYPIVSSTGIVGKHSTFKIKGPGVITGRSGTIGKVIYESNNFWPLNTTLFVSDFKGNDPKYVFYWLQHFDLQHYTTGSTVPTLNRNDLANLTIDIPDAKEQKNRIKILEIIDKKIANNNAISKELESMAKTIYDYWFLQFEFPDKDGKPYKSNGGKMVWNDQLKQEIPKGWEVGTLDQLFQITMGTSPKGDTLNQDSNGVEFYQGSTDFGDLYPQLRVFTTNPIKKVMAQDILLSVRAPVGALNLAKNDCSIGRGLAGIHYDLSSTYAWNKLKSFQKYFDIFNSTGTTFGSLTGEMLNKLIVIIPDTKIIKLYANKTNFIEKAMKMYNIENQQLKSLRDFLLPLLMNGQVSITD